MSQVARFQLPTKWSMVRLGDHLKLINGRAYKREELLDSGTPVLRIQNLNGGNRWYFSDLELPSDKYCDAGDLLFAWSATFGPYIWNGPRAIYHYHIWKILPEPTIDKRYAFRMLEWITESVKAAAHGITMVHITKASMENWEIPLPPLEEQRRIAAILDTADTLRTKRRQAIAKLDTLLQSTFLTMFGDPVTNPMGWEVRPLERICQAIIDCPHSTPKWSNSGVICLRTSNLTVGGWDWTDTRYVTEHDYKVRTKRSEIAAGDIILSREGTVGIAAIVQAGMRVCMGQRLVQVRSNTEKVTSEFLLRYLLYELAPERIQQFMAGSTSKHLNVKDLRKLNVFVPPLRLQVAYEQIAGNLSKQARLNGNNLAVLDDLFNSLQQRAFRGDL